MLRADVPSGRIVRLDISKAAAHARRARDRDRGRCARHDRDRHRRPPAVRPRRDPLRRRADRRGRGGHVDAGPGRARGDRGRDRAAARGPHHGGRAWRRTLRSCIPTGATTRFCSKAARARGNVAWEATVVRGDVDAAFARPDVEIVESCLPRRPPEPCRLRAARGGRKLRRRPLPYRDVDAGALDHPQRDRAPAGRAGLPGSRHRAAGRRRLRPQIRSRDRALCRPARAGERTAGPARQFARGRDAHLPVSRERRNPHTLGGDARRRDRRTRGRGADGLRRLWRRADFPDHDDRPYARRKLLGSARCGWSRARSIPTPPRTAPSAPATASTTPSRSSGTPTKSRARIGMDPLAFRRRNVLGDGDLGATGQVFEGDVLGPMLDRMDTMRDAAATPPEAWRRPALWPRDRRSARGSSLSAHRRRP